MPSEWKEDKFDAGTEAYKREVLHQPLHPRRHVCNLLATKSMAGKMEVWSCISKDGRCRRSEDIQ